MKPNIRQQSSRSAHLHHVMMIFGVLLHWCSFNYFGAHMQTHNLTLPNWPQSYVSTKQPCASPRWQSFGRHTQSAGIFCNMC